jgi:NADH dehydrogenase/NADH:ubiquinone oxidoreductase subunit G
MIKMTIDGRKVQAKEGSTVLQNLQNLKIEVPTLCFHQDLIPFGACRLCTVEVKSNGKWQMATSCNTTVADDMEIRTATEKVKESRKLAAELLYYKYPTTKAVRDIAAKLGVEVSPSAVDGKECILCGLCTRTCHEVVGVDALTFEDRGLDRNVEDPKIIYVADSCIGCGSCAFVCPTGFVKMEEKSGGKKRKIWDKEFKMAACKVCGRYFAPVDQLKWISKSTKVPLKKLMTCTSCR